MNGRFIATLSWVLVVFVAAAAYASGSHGLIIAAAGAVVVLAAIITASISGSKMFAAKAREESFKVDTHERGAREDLRLLIAMSIFVHLGAALVFFVTRFNLSVAPDSEAYLMRGTYIAMSWDNPATDPWLIQGYNPKSLYQHLNAIAVYAIGEKYAMLILSMLNGVLATFAAYLFSRLSLGLFGPIAARRTFILCAFFPSLVLWTSINLREAWSFLFLAGVLLNAHKLRTDVTTRSIVLFALSATGLAFVRSYMVFVVAAGLGMAYMAVRAKRLPATMLMMIVVGAVLATISGRFGRVTDFTSFNLEDKLALVDQLHRGLSYSGRHYGVSWGGSSYSSSYDLSTPQGILMHLPRGVATFLFAPFPWSIGSWRQALALPETFVWYYFFIQAVRAMWREGKKQVSNVAVPLFVVLMITVAFGIIEGNEGTAYRHRAHAMLLYFIFSGGEHAFRTMRGKARDRETVSVLTQRSAGVKA